MKGASASRARRRAISVLPTPVGPIIRMFLGVISPRSFSSTCWRRQRLRRAMATALLAAACPTMWRSSSETISWGVMEDMMRRRSLRVGRAERSTQGLDGVVHVGIDAKLAGDFKRLLDDVAGPQLGVVEQAFRRGLGVGTAGTNRHDAVLGLQDISISGDDQRRFQVGYRQHGLETAQDAVGPPILCEFDGGA